VHGTNLVLQAKVKPDTKTWQREQAFAEMSRDYCDYSNLYWLAVRRIHYNLIYLMYDNDGTLLHQEQFTPKDCPLLIALRR
jgi:hypothetical protein